MATPTIFCATCGAANQPNAAQCFACGNPPLVAAASTPTPAAGSSSRSFTGLLAANSVLRERYRLQGQVGKGGMGAVYRAEDMHLGNRVVAVKEMSQRGLTPEELKDATESFQREALILAGLSHPSLPDIYDHFEEAGRWYLVMKFIEGQSLEARLNSAPGKRLSLEETLQISLQLTRVLAYLHAQTPPIIFRDLKPANIMLTAEGHVYLIDFGIARLFRPGERY